MQNTPLDSAHLEYVAEFEESFVRLERAFAQLAASSPNKELLDLVYREVHTIKGSSQLFGFAHVAEVAHAMENCLDPLRRRLENPSPALSAALQRASDVMNVLVGAIKTGSNEDHSAVVREAVAGLRTGDALAAPRIETTPELVAAKPEPPAPKPEAARVDATAKTEAAPADNGEATTVRVSVSLLDKLMTLTGEMVLVRNQVLRYSSRADELEFLNLSQRLDVVTSEMQAEVMKTRMQPIGNVVTKFQRVVRDLARDLNKKIELSFSGMETELDRTLLEAVKDPIMHIVRNSCDHGLEKPDERRAAGKGEIGVISIRAFQEGGQVVVEIADDGRGLDRAKLVAKAIEKKIVSPEAAATMSERDSFGLIFAAGFSTAAAVTNVSGRGVGMDVVKTNIEGIGGTVELRSELGQGTVLRLKIPLTLAIVPAMIVRLEQHRYVIPQVKITELVRVEPGGANAIEILQGKPIYRLRGNLLPLVSLSQVLGRPPRKESETTNIAVLNAEGTLFGLILDEVLETAEVVVKPLGPFLKGISAYSGATVLGDGAVALILDVQNIALGQGLVEKDQRVGAAAGFEKTVGELQEFLLVGVNSDTTHALPLNLVHRLEEFPRAAVEVSGQQLVVRYRNSILPLISVNEMLGLPKAEPTGETISVIVSQKSGRAYGLEVNEILDVLRTTAEVLEPVKADPMLLGNVIDHDEVVVILDTLHMMDVFAGVDVGVKPVEAFTAKRRILFAEDTVFFRRHVTNILAKAGYEVTTAEDGAEALATLRDRGAAAFDMILSDIEMPKMNGIELVRAVRADQNFAHLPMVALTTKYDPVHKQEGLTAGYDQYLEKLKSDVLLTEMAALMTKSKRRAA